ncbi:hypothetical protein P4O66_000804 [Electrophorus voltai]|uniref:Uncharacterized protein n=1 Tax=Electrophorus voltai TaxID=2609070 RepID=A0AAD8ZH96_9TELE|nr:hypothetical protein P4O66_000804 [Electrophorus voltai]
MRSDLGSDYGENSLMEVEEDPHWDSLMDSQIHSVISGNDEHLARTIPSKASPRRFCLGANEPVHTELLEATSSEEETPSTRAYNPGTRAPVPKLCTGKGEVTPVPTPETGKVTPQAGRTQALPTTGGQAGAPAGLPGLFNSPLCSFVPVPTTLSVPVALSPFVSVPVPVSVSMPVPVSVSVPVPVSVFVPASVVVLVPLLPPSVLLALVHVGSLGPPALQFAVGFGAVARKAGVLEGGALSWQTFFATPSFTLMRPFSYSHINPLSLEMSTGN